MVRTLSILLLLLFLISCDSRYKKNILEIKGKYSVEEINNFYEVAFADHQTRRFLSRWKNDLYYFIEGDTLSGDGKIVEEIAKELNDLDLSVRIKKARTKESANLIINSCLKENSNIKSNFIPAKTNVSLTDFQISKCHMEIVKDHSNKRWMELRRAILLHEFGHVMGLLGHSAIRYNSFIHPSSICFSMNEEDMKLLHILYDPLWPDKYSKHSFEEDFADMLYTINTKEKLKRFIALNHIDKEILKKIYDFGFTTPTDTSKADFILKYGNPVKVVTKGDLPLEWIKIIRKAINEINVATPNIKMEYLGSNPDSDFMNGSIEFIFRHDPTMTKDSILSYTSKTNQSASYSVKDKTLIKFVYKERYAKIKKILPSIIYECLGIPLPPNEEPFILEGDKLYLKPEFKDLLKVYYAPDLPHTFKKKELDNVIKDYDRVVTIFKK